MSNQITLADIANNHILFSHIFLKVSDKDKKIVPLILKPVQKRILREMGSRTLILKARQMGVSTLMQSLLYRLAITRTISGLVLSHEDTSTQGFRRMFTRFNEHMPDEYRPEFNFNNRTIISFNGTGSEILVATAGGSGQVGRGFSFSHIHFSEVAFTNNAEYLIAGAIQAGNPSVVLESTANGTSGYFYELCMQALTDPDKTAWKLLFYPWFEEPEYKYDLRGDKLSSLTSTEEMFIERYQLTHEQLFWRREKIKEIGLRLFKQEYPSHPEEAFLTTGVGYFSDIPWLDEQQTAPMYTEPDESHQYVAGLDLGRLNDYTVLSIFDVNTGNEVDILRIKGLPWQTIVTRVVERLKHWNVNQFWVETNNVGDSVFEMLDDEIDREGLSTTLRQLNMNRRNKPKLVNAFHVGLEERSINLLPAIPNAGENAGACKQELQTFTAKQTDSGNWTFKAEGKSHDDTVMARVISYHGLQNFDMILIGFI